MAAPFKNVIFNRPNGSIFRQHVIPIFGNDNTTNYPDIRSASIMIVSYIPVIGDTSRDNSTPNYYVEKLSPFNACMADLYIKLRSKNVSLGNYTSADVGKALLALDSIYGLLSELDVDINALSEYSFENTATRGMIQEVLWGNPALARKNIANIITERNNLADAMSVLPFVPGIPFLQDHIDWSRFVYKDDNLDKSALILFRRGGFWRWAVNANDPNPGELVLCFDSSNYNGYSSINHNIIKAEEKFTILNKLVRDYTMDDDFQNLCVEIAHAFGIDTAKYHIPYLPEDTTKFKLETKYDLDVIDSLRSADFASLDYNHSVRGITEDTNGNLIYTSDFGSTPSGKFTVPYWDFSNNKYRCTDTGNGRILFSYEDSPTEEAVAVIARYVHDYVNRNPGTDTHSEVYGLKTEFITGLQTWFVDDDLSYTAFYEDIFVYKANNTAFDNRKIEGVVCSLISHPMIYGVQIAGDGGFTGTVHYLPKDIDNLGYLPKLFNISYAQSFMWNKFFGYKKGNNPKKNKKSDSDTNV